MEVPNGGLNGYHQGSENHQGPLTDPQPEVWKGGMMPPPPPSMQPLPMKPPPINQEVPANDFPQDLNDKAKEESSYISSLCKSHPPMRGKESNNVQTTCRYGKLSILIKLLDTGEPLGNEGLSGNRAEIMSQEYFSSKTIQKRSHPLEDKLPLGKKCH